MAAECTMWRLRRRRRRLDTEDREQQRKWTRLGDRTWSSDRGIELKVNYGGFVGLCIGKWVNGGCLDFYLTAN